MSMGSHFNRKWKNAFALKSASTNVPYFRGKTADSFGQSADTLVIAPIFVVQIRYIHLDHIANLNRNVLWDRKRGNSAPTCRYHV